MTPRLNETRMGAVIGTVMGDAFAVRASTATYSTMHAQHGVALFVGLEAPVCVIDEHGREAQGHVVVVPPDLANSVASPGPTIGFMLDAELGPRMSTYSRGRGGAFAVEGRAATEARDAARLHRASIDRPDVLAGLADELSRRLSRDSSPARLDARVSCVLEALRDPSNDHAAALARTRISTAHLQALFTRDVGVSMRTFRLWRRLLDALVAFARGDATQAAHRSGFADLAHFSRTCRRMLGYSPTSLRSGVTLE